MIKGSKFQDLTGGKKIGVVGLSLNHLSKAEGGLLITRLLIYLSCSLVMFVGYFLGYLSGINRAFEVVGMQQFMSQRGIG